jgi:hypothetical protein
MWMPEYPIGVFHIKIAVSAMAIHWRASQFLVQRSANGAKSGVHNLTTYCGQK